MFQSAVAIEAAGARGQDRAVVIPHAGGVVAALADGAGGISGGADAADIVIMWVRAFVDRAHNMRSAQRWVELLAYIDRQIHGAGGRTTAVVVALFEDLLVGASVGDSGAWVISSDSVDDLTEAQAHKPLLGTGISRPVGFNRPALDGTLLVASDGLLKYAPRQRIAECARGANLDQAAHSLIDLTRLKSRALNDDAAVILCRHGTPPQTPPHRAHSGRYILTPGGDLIEPSPDQE